MCLPLFFSLRRFLFIFGTRRLVVHSDFGGWALEDGWKTNCGSQSQTEVVPQPINRIVFQSSRAACGIQWPVRAAGLGEVNRPMLQDTGQLCVGNFLRAEPRAEPRATTPSVQATPTVRGGEGGNAATSRGSLLLAGQSP